MPQLEEINFSGNHIVKIQELKKINKIKKLILKSNKVNDFWAIQEMNLKKV